jgi:predicted nucleic acid-binding protein
VTVLYDTGALVGAERHDRRVWAIHEQLMIESATPVVPSVVLAQAWRGGPQAQLSRLLHGCDIEPVGERLARSAGVACAKAGTSDVIDAIVVVRALQLGALVVTSDSADLERISDALDRQLRIVTL